MLKAQAASARKQAEAERDELHAKTAKMLAGEREGLPRLTVHEYFSRKGAQIYGDIRQGLHGRANIPVFDAEDNLQSVQDIFPDGRKQFATDAKMKGGRLVCGTLKDGEDINLFEGYATAASGYESGIGACVCCFFGSNLAVVAADLRARYPNSFIRIAGDLDAHGAGEKYAKAALAETMPNSAMILPTFSDGRESGDFNDLHQFAGLSEVREQLEAARSDSAQSDGAVDADAHPTKFDAPVAPQRRDR